MKLELKNLNIGNNEGTILIESLTTDISVEEIVEIHKTYREALTLVKDLGPLILDHLTK